jgi:hypothetical protein
MRAGSDRAHSNPLTQVKPACPGGIILLVTCQCFCPNQRSTGFSVSIPQAAAISFPREEALLVASLLALTGGYLDAYSGEEAA